MNDGGRQEKVNRWRQLERTLDRHSMPQLFGQVSSAVFVLGLLIAHANETKGV